MEANLHNFDQMVSTRDMTAMTLEMPFYSHLSPLSLMIHLIEDLTEIQFFYHR